MLDRADAYIGVLIDDLVTRGTSEPYRMFTSRAEYRLTLRADNADQRLTPIGLRLGCVGGERAQALCRRRWRRWTRRGGWPRAAADARPALRRHGIAVNADGIARSAAELLAYPGIDLARLAAIWPELGAIAPDIAEQLEIDARYAGYLERQERDIAAFRRDEALLLPDGLDYAAVGSLSREIRGKLAAARPATLGAAARISGVTPAALVALLQVRQAPAGAARRVSRRLGAGGLRRALTGVSRETLARLEAYAELLTRWSARINLVGRDTLGDLWRRHILDSAQLLPLVPHTARSLIDLGSGAGFPGLVLAILGVPGVELIEADSRKCRFSARGGAGHRGARSRSAHAGIEAVPPHAADVVTARACAPLDRCSIWPQRFLAPDTLCLFLKGERVERGIDRRAQSAGQ